MLNVKTCEDTFLNQPRDRQQNTHTHTLLLSAAPLSRSTVPSTSGPLTTVDPLPDLGKTVAEKMLQILSQKIQLSASSPDFWSHFSEIFHHVCYFSQGCFEPIRLNGLVVVVVVVVVIVVVDRIPAEQCHKPRAHPLATGMSAVLLFLFVCKWRVI